ncbi:hypothetical protein L6R49_11115 [Myxococcota bacterium]|nr:hypothetical protein [Myxococcota bacterium]
MRAKTPLLALLITTSTTAAGCVNDFGLEAIEPKVEGGLTDTAPTEEEPPAEEEEPPAEEEEPPAEEEPVEEEDPAPVDDCERTSDLVYVIAQDDASLHLFDPETLSFTRLGELACDAWSQPESMSVGRDGVAYVRYSDEAVYAVDVETLACAPTGYSDRATGFGAFGMGHATDSAETWRDQLYVANSRQLARLDTSTWTLTTLGTMKSQAELSGDADGQLWGLLPLESPALLVELDKASGAILSTTKLPGFPDASEIDTFAFAAWGGEHFLFVRVFGMGSTTDVYRVDSGGKLSLALSDIGFEIVGAGVSTCAPTE